MVNDKASGTASETSKPPPPKVVMPAARAASAPPNIAAPNLPPPPPPPPSAQARPAEAALPAAPAPPTTQAAEPVPPVLPPQVTGPPAPAQPAPAETPSARDEKAAAAPPDEAPPVAEKKVREYRYRTRVLKAAILPVLFSLMSFLMLYNYVTGYEPYFEYNFDIILAGFAVGLVVTTGFLVANMRVARRDGSHVSRLRTSLFIALAFLVPYLYLMMFESLSLAWKFSIGYFFSAMLTPVVVMVYESQSRGKFYVQEEEVDDRLTRTLVFRA